MRLLHIISEMDPKKGGVGQAVRTMMTGLSEAGLENEVVSLDAPDAMFITDNTLKIYALGPCKGPWCFSSKLLPWLMKNLVDYDTVIVHGLWLYHGYAVRKAFHGLNIKHKRKGEHGKLIPKLFIMPHGMLDPYFQRAAGRRLKALRNYFYWKLIEEKLINGADGLFFTSKEEQKLARAPFRPYHPKSEIVVSLGIEEPPSFTPLMRKAFVEKCSGIENSSYILYIGRIDEKKGIDLLIKAYKKWFRRQYKATTHSSLPKLVIAGPGMETSYGQHIRQLASDLQSHIIFPGMLTSNAKWGAFYGCDVFVLPSHQENFGIAVVEALACGKPVLISDQVNIWQEIKASCAGLIEKNTEEGTLKLLESWSNLSDDKKQKMSLEALNCFKEKFSIAPVAYRIINAVAGTKASLKNA